MVVFGESEGFDPAMGLLCGGCCAALGALFVIILAAYGIVYFIRRDRPPPDA